MAPAVRVAAMSECLAGGTRGHHSRRLSSTHSEWSAGQGAAALVSPLEGALNTPHAAAWPPLSCWALALQRR